MPSPVSAPLATLSCQALLFDMDGILISSIGSVERSWTKWSLMRGVDPAYAISVIHGRRAIDSLRAIRPDLDADKELDILEDIECEDVDDIVVLPGVRELLTRLPHDRWTVVTSATARLARIRLDAAGLPVPDAFVYGEMVAEGKPHPAPFLAGAALLKVTPEDCLAFEDSTSGVAAARAAGCTVIATTFTHPSDDLHLADYIVPDLTAVTVTADSASLRITLSRP